MATTQASLYSDFAKRHRAQGQAEEARNTIRLVLKARGLTLTEEQGGQVDACDDLETLKQWSEAAVTANAPDDIFR